LSDQVSDVTETLYSCLLPYEFSYQPGYGAKKAPTPQKLP